MGNTIAVAEQVYEEQEQVEEQEQQNEKEETEETEAGDKSEGDEEDKTVREGGEEDESSGERGDEEETVEEESEEGGEEVEEEKPKITVDDIKTAPMDFRFPTTNQAKHCYTRYNEYHKCAAEKGEDAKECQKYARYYRSLCPGDWIEKWNEERENGTYPGRY